MFPFWNFSFFGNIQNVKYFLMLNAGLTFFVSLSLFFPRKLKKKMEIKTHFINSLFNECIFYDLFPCHVTFPGEWNKIGLEGFETRVGGGAVSSCLFSQGVCLYKILVYEISRLKLNFSQSVLHLNTLIHDLIFLKIFLPSSLLPFRLSVFFTFFPCEGNLCHLLFVTSRSLREEKEELNISFANIWISKPYLDR